MEFRDIPLHPLLVHAVVVLLPLTALAAILVSVWPAARRKLTFLVPLGALVVLVIVPVTLRAGSDLWQTRFGSAPAEIQAEISDHAELGQGVLLWSIALFVLTTAQYVLFRRSQQPRRVFAVVLAVLVIVAAVGGIVQVAMAGDAGAHLVWGS